MKEIGVDISNHRSKHVKEFLGQHFHYIITVCDKAAGEMCPLWPAQPISAHWGAPDPAAVQGTDEQRLKAFVDSAMIMKRRIELFLSLPLESLDKLSLQNATREIGKQ